VVALLAGALLANAPALLSPASGGGKLIDGKSIAAKVAPRALPASLSFGLASEPGALTWMTSSGVPWTYRYTYLSAGVNTGSGWETWNTPAGQYATYYMTDSASNGYIPVFSYYELLQSNPSVGSNESDRNFSNLNNANTMNAYYANFVLLMQKAGAFGGQVIVQVEPDLWGYLEQRAGTGSAATLTAMVQSSGHPDVAGIPDTAQGFAGALLHIRDKYAPNAIMATHASLWGSGVDIGTNTDTSRSPSAEADKVAAFLNSAGVASNPWGSTWDLVFNDVADHDAGWFEKVGGDGGAHWWDRQNLKLPNFAVWLQWMTELHVKTGRPLIEWQVPVGNQYYLTMNNTDGHYQDNRAEYFLANTASLQAAGITAVLFGAGNPGTTTYTDAKGDGITNNNGAPTTDTLGSCNACNTHTSTYADDDGGYLRVFVGQFYSPPPPSVAHLTAVSQQQYRLPNSDGKTWVDIDTANLSLSLTPTQDSVALITGNSDLWTANAGLNQDLAVSVSGGTFGSGTVVAWKESGGYAGTFSPNAAAVRTTFPLANGVTYTVKLQWKTNLPSRGGTIFAGAGPLGTGYSPTRLTAQLFPASGTIYSASTTAQPCLGGSNGVTWTDVDATTLKLNITPTQDSLAILSGNADLWTSGAGLNQDLGISVSTNGGVDQLVAWKESGGFAGTYSPNAALVQTVVHLSAATPYSIKLRWKTNKPSGSMMIHIGAGPIGGNFSPTSLIAQLVPVAANSLSNASSTQQYQLHGSDGITWTAIDSSTLTLSFSAGSATCVILTGNADLFTANAGYNQDLALALDSNVVGWKESGGYAGTMSPNAAYVQTVVPIAAGSHTATLMWKTNRRSGTGTIFAAAGGGAPYSNTTLAAELISC
jgi:hypothetical protein